jgi:hypothetical protein
LKPKIREKERRQQEKRTEQQSCASHKAFITTTKQFPFFQTTIHNHSHLNHKLRTNPQHQKTATSPSFFHQNHKIINNHNPKSKTK